MVDRQSISHSDRDSGSQAHRKTEKKGKAFFSPAIPGRPLTDSLGVCVLQDILVNGKNSSVLEVKENQPGARVGEIRVVDEDLNDTHTLFLSGSASSQFTVHSGQLWVGGDALMSQGVLPCSRVPLLIYLDTRHGLVPLLATDIHK